MNNPASLAGMGVATAAAALFLVLSLLETLGLLVNPYLGLLVFVTLPALFLGGLLLIPIGAWRSARRRRLRPGAPEWPLVDLNEPRQRAIVGGVLALTFANVVIVSLAAYGGVHYMDSTAFCGQVCHTTMAPQYEAHQVWPHAEVRCAECHVGPGAGSFLEAKLAGTRQLYHLATGAVPRPIPAPLRPISDPAATCGQCHMRGTSPRDILREIKEYGDDEESTEVVTALHMKVGGPDGGIHRHLALVVEYVATDSRRESIPYVRVEDADGRVREFRSSAATPDVVATGERRGMDCLDCHNRPAHTFDPTPQRAVDRALASGSLPRGLPFIRREAVAAVSAEYVDRDAALAGIAERLAAFYAARPEAEEGVVARAVVATQGVWARNVFPAMRVNWGTYPSHLGHVDSPGCFRCHDDDHMTADGEAISGACDLCHEFQ